MLPKLFLKYSELINFIKWIQSEKYKKITRVSLEDVVLRNEWGKLYE